LSRLLFGDAPVEITSSGRAYSVSLDDRLGQVELVEADQGRMLLLIDGRRVVAYVSPDRSSVWVTTGGRTFRLKKSITAARSAASHDASSELAAPMPGQVRAVNVNAGDAVTKGQVLMVLEAMKMEIRLHAPFDGQISSVEAGVGQTVEREQLLIRLHRRDS